LQARVLLSAIAAAGSERLTTRCGAVLQAAPAPPTGTAAALAADAAAAAVEWFQVSGTLPQVRSQVDALIGARCATATAAAAVAARLADASAPQWRRTAGCAASPEPALASARQLAERLSGATPGPDLPQGWARHDPSGLWLPVSLVLRLAGRRAEPPPNSSAGAAAGLARARLQRGHGQWPGPRSGGGVSGDVYMEDAIAVVVQLRAAPGYGEALDRAVAMEVDWEGLAEGGGSMAQAAAATAAVGVAGAGRSGGGGGGASSEEEEYGRGAGLKRRLAGGGYSGLLRSCSGPSAPAAAPAPARPAAARHAGPAPHPLSPYPHAGPGLPAPRLLLLLDTNILLEPRGWAVVGGGGEPRPGGGGEAGAQSQPSWGLERSRACAFPPAVSG
jgi:hypothetical protein